MNYYQRSDPRPGKERIRFSLHMETTANPADLLDVVQALNYAVDRGWWEVLDGYGPESPGLILDTVRGRDGAVNASRVAALRGDRDELKARPAWDAYLAEKEELGFTKGNLANSRTVWKRLGLSEGMPLREVTSDQVVEALRGVDASTFNMYRSLMSAFFTWAMKRERERAHREGREPLLTMNPVEFVKTRRVKTDDLRRLLTPHDRAALVSAARPGMRRVAVAISVSTAARSIEVCRLAREDLSLVDGCYEVQIQNAKGKGGYRTIPTGRDMVPLVSAYLDTLEGDWLFPSRNRKGKHVQAQAVRVWFAEACERAGIPFGKNVRNGVTHHRIRHSLTTDFFLQGKSAHDVAKWMGNSSKVVEEHYALLGDRKMVKVLRTWRDEMEAITPVLTPPSDSTP